jgi:hypothetical protein
VRSARPHAGASGPSRAISSFGRPRAKSLSPFYLTQWNDFATNINRDLPSDRRIAVFTVETLNRPVQQQPRISDLADVLELGNPSDSMLFRLTPENHRAICVDGADYTFFVNESLTSPEIVAALKSNKYKYMSMHLDYTDTGVSYDDGIYRIQFTGTQVVLSFRYVPVCQRNVVLNLRNVRMTWATLSLFSREMASK